MQSLHTLALLCIAVCLVAPTLASLSGGNIEGDSFIVAGRCTATTLKGTNAPLCTTFCRGGDCSNVKNVYSFAIPADHITQDVQPSQIVNTLYEFQIEDPTIVGVAGGNKLVIFACRDSNCADYNQATYITLPGNDTFGSSIATTLTAESHLAILYSKKRAYPNTGVEVWLDVCKDPLCAIKGSSAPIDTFGGDAELWLGYDVNKNTPIIMIQDVQNHLLRAYSCSSTTVCSPTTLVSATDSITSFTIAAQQTGTKKTFKTVGFNLAYATFQTPGDIAMLYTKSCTSDLTKCEVQVEALGPYSTPFLALASVPVPSSSNFLLSFAAHSRVSTTIATPVAQAPAVAISTGTTITDTISLGMATCSGAAPCSAPTIGNFTLPFAADSTLQVGVTILSSDEAGTYAIAQASNQWQATADPAASSIYGLSTKGFFGPLPMSPDNIKVSKYHKPPPKVTVGLFILAGIAVVTSALVIAWRVWVGRPNSKPGYAHIN